jgi:dolichol kinase
MLIISAIVEGKNWKASDWIPVCGIWALSIIASIIGAQIGKRKAISGNNKTN